MSLVANLLTRVRLALQRGDMAGAEAACRAVLDHAPAQEEALSFLAQRALARGEAAAVIELLTPASQATDASGLVLYHYGCALEAVSERAAARDAFDRAYRAEPELVMALFLRGDQELALGDREQALRTYSCALDRARTNGLLADLDRLPPEMGRRIRPAHACVTQARAEYFERALAPLIGAYGEPALRRVHEALAIQAGLRPAPKAKPHQHPCFLLIPGLDAPPWHAREHFTDLAVIEARTDEIRAELIDLLRDESVFAPYVDMPDNAPAAHIWRALNRSPQWSAYHFFRDGDVVREHAARCPRTFEALNALPLMRVPAHGPEALFSVLKPHTRIPPHTGVMNGRLTVHLPLIVPPDCGALKCGDEQRAWVEGQCLIFDDSLIHSAWNDSAHTRVVLIFDLWDPQLSAIERAGVAALVEAIGAFNQRYGRLSVG